MEDVVLVDARDVLQGSAGEALVVVLALEDLLRARQVLSSALSDILS